MSSVASRFSWVVDRLPVKPTSRVLEIGCGHGVALACVAARLGPRGLIVGVDRSATMIAKARATNAAAIRDGRVVVRTGELASVELPEAPLDLAFAINVNLVWTRDARDELARLRVLVPRGPVVWCFEAPPGRDDSFVARAADHLAAAGYRVETERGSYSSKRSMWMLRSFSSGRRIASAK